MLVFAHAHAHAQARFGVASSHSLNPDIDNVIVVDPQAPLGVSRSHVGDPGQSSHSMGVVDWGVLKAQSDASSDGALRISSSVTAAWSDRVTITATTGEPLFVDLIYAFNFQNVFSGFRSTVADSWGISTNTNLVIESEDPAGGAPLLSGYSFTYNDNAQNTLWVESISLNGQVVSTLTGNPEPNQPFSRSVSMRVPIFSGVPFVLSKNLACATTTLIEDSWASCDAGSSAYWGGLTVVDANGLPVSGWTLTSDAGIDWQQSFIPAVPEPSTWALLFAGLSVLGVVARRQKSPSQA